MRHRLSATHVLIDSDSESIAGYYTLAAASIGYEDIPEALRRKSKLSRYPQLSAVLLARLARHQDWRAQGVGSVLLADALERSWRSTSHIGAAFVLVDATDQRATEFYASFGFIPLEDSPRRLFLPMTTVAQLFAG